MVNKMIRTYGRTKSKHPHSEHLHQIRHSSRTTSDGKTRTTKRTKGPLWMW